MEKRWKIYTIMGIALFLVLNLIWGCSGGSDNSVTTNHTTIIPSLTPTSPTSSPSSSPTLSPTPSISPRPTPTGYNSVPIFIASTGLDWPVNMTNGSILIANRNKATLAHYNQAGEYLGNYNTPEKFGSIWKNRNGTYIGGSATSKKFYVTSTPDNPWQSYETNGDQIMDVRSLSNNGGIFLLILKEINEQPYYLVEKWAIGGQFISAWQEKNDWSNPVALELNKSKAYTCFRGSNKIMCTNHLGEQAEYINVNLPQDIYLWNDYLYVIHLDNSNPANTCVAIYDTLNQNQKIFEQEIQNLQNGSSILVLPDGSIVVGSYAENKIMKFSWQ